jgi:hypothetical protein
MQTLSNNLYSQNSQVTIVIHVIGCSPASAALATAGALEAATASSPTETSALAGDDMVRHREFRTSVGLLAPYRLGEDRSWHQRRLRAPNPGLPVHAHFLRDASGSGTHASWMAWA